MEADHDKAENTRLVWLVAWSLRSFARTASADEPAKAGERSGAPLRFHLRNTPTFHGVIQSLAADGSGVAVEQEPRTPISRRMALTEGDYLGLVAAHFVHNIPDGAVVARLSVTEVLDNHRCRFQVAADAAAKFKTGQEISLIRPYGSTSQEIQAVPSFAVVNEKANEALGMMTPSQAAKLNLSMARLKLIGLALLNYENAYTRLPPFASRGSDHKPLLSWRMLILPMLDEIALYKQFNRDEPWDSPTNKPLLDKMPEIYRDPIYGESTDHYTNYAAISGPGTVFPTDSASGRETNSSLRGISISQIADGTHDTLAMGSVSPKSKIPWTKPEDIVCDRNLPPLGQLGSFATPHKNAGKSAGVFASCDDRVLAIRSDIDMNLFLQLTTRAGGEAIDEAKIPQLPSIGEIELVLVISRVDGGSKASLEAEIMPDSDR